MPVLPASVLWSWMCFGYRRPLYRRGRPFYAGNPLPVPALHKTPGRGSDILENSGQTGNYPWRQKQSRDIMEEIRLYGIWNYRPFVQIRDWCRRTGKANKKSAGFFLSFETLFPFNGCGRFSAYIIYHAVDTFHLVD